MEANEIVADVDIIESQYNDLSAIIVNEIAYFNLTEFQRRFFDMGYNPCDLEKLMNVNLKNRTISLFKENAEPTLVDMNNENDFIIYRGESYLSVNYYPI